MAPLSGELAHLTEEENLRRMAAGQLYHAFTPQLTQARYRCVRAHHRFNNSKDPSRRERVRLWRELVQDSRPMPPKLDDEQADEDQFHTTDPYIDAPLAAVDYGYNVQIAPTAYLNRNCTFIDTCVISIGARTLIGPGCHFYSGTHPLDPSVRNGIEGPEGGGRIVVSEDCWIGGNVTVVQGVTIGRGATVGGGSVVTKDVPPFHLVAGNPARVLRRIESAWDPERGQPAATMGVKKAGAKGEGPEGAMAQQARDVEAKGV